MKGLLRFLAPGGLVLAAVAVFVLLEDADPALELVTGRYAVVLYGAGALLAGAFHRSRVVAALLAFACVEVLSGVARGRGESLLLPLATLLIVLLGVLAVTRDRGVTSRGGLAQLACAALVGVGGYLALRDPDRVSEGLATRLLPLPEGAIDAVGLPEPVLIAGAAALLLVAYGVFRWRGPVEQALLWGLVAVLLSILPPVTPAEASFVLMCAGLVLAVSVLETSYFMAYRDELTGLPARRALVHDLGEIGGTYTLAMVDVDHFKKFNDKHGHDVGDQVLQLVAKHLAAGPGGGKAYRYGGEEFTIVYPGRVCDDAQPHAEAVRASVEKATFSLRAWNRPRKKPKGGKQGKKKRRARKLSVRISIGLADSTGKSAEPTEVLKKADKALYRAKGEGRNRVAK
ncbi:MAG: GGDEF domain-containing protein [Gemmatimonadota bacterium]|jgi:diguanylate cyclase (GGDEF)-like protein